MKFEFRYKGRKEARIDKALLALVEKNPDLEWMTRSQIKKLIEAGKVFCNGVPVLKSGASIELGDVLELSVEPEPTELIAEDLNLPIVYEDASLLVVDKPAGISMHPGAGRRTGTVVHGVLSRLKEKNGERPGIIHRLDKDTTGLVVIGKTTEVVSSLSEQFSSRTVGRKYKALVFCTPRAQRPVGALEEGRIESLLGRDPRDRRKQAVVDSGGRAAITTWKRIERMLYGALVEVTLLTGRTHQIRVHMSHIKCPVIGDKVYGDFTALPQELKRIADQFGRQALHAAVLEFTHPISGKRLRFESELPDDFKSLCETFRSYRQ